MILEFSATNYMSIKRRAETLIYFDTAQRVLL